jgi:single-strand DNA-binding protein
MINSVVLVGNLGNDPGFKKLENGTMCSEFSIACNENYLSNGQKTERTHWFSCDAFGKTAEACQKYLKKGCRVGVRGVLQYRSWVDDKGVKKSLVKINVKEVEFLDVKPGASQKGIGVPDPMEDF